LDLACGAGRHAIFIASKGNAVTGLDLASNSIAEAKAKVLELPEKLNIEFQVADMRDFDLKTSFDLVFNLFTSFGYFENKNENLDVLANIKKHQAKGGILVIDYLNSQLVRAKGEESYTKVIDAIQFEIHKYFEGDFVKKEIKVIDQNGVFHFREQVQLFESNELESMLSAQGYQMTEHFGDYDLRPYSQTSPRSIWVGTRL
jgi:SAM-dependent methyltransferase